jgi:hypothetical protein
MADRRRSLSHTLKRIVGRSSIQAINERRIVTAFAEKLGLVYFGRVDQYTDDHHSVRGFTASPHHEDNHYSVGSFDGYDVSYVQRSEQLDSGDIRKWSIVEVDLHHDTGIPHLVVTAKGHADGAYDALFAASSHLLPIPMGTVNQYDQEFVSRYTTYTQASHFIRAEHLIDSDVSRTIAAHFWPLSVEIRDQMLIVYSVHQRMSLHLLETMLKNALWLAHHIDSHAHVE